MSQSVTPKVITLGLDPDLHQTAVAVISEGKYVLALDVIEVDKKLIAQNAVMAMCHSVASLFLNRTAALATVDYALVEHMDVSYSSKQGAVPQDMVNVNAVSGAATGVLCCYCKRNEAAKPKDWKQSQPKRINQARTFQRLGWSYMTTKHKKEGDRYCYPIDTEWNKKFSKGQWKHLGDALGMALVAYDRIYEEQRRTRVLGLSDN